MNTIGGIRWLRVLVAAFVAEVALFALVVPLRFLPNGFTIELYTLLPACPIALFLAGLWAARGAPRGRVLHGALTWKQALPTIFVVSNYFKIVVGTAGGAFAGYRTASTRPAISS